ncbi:MAG: glycine--tRNA ligase subunit beta, partial [Chloroflexi bacterium]|nr:glycine--tRNA ligase subunit beta [Chloroflexota bacterium]
AAHKLADFTPRLATLTFQEKLGSMLDKVHRVEALTPALAPMLGLSDAELATAARAAALFKSDLATQMVVELTSLQGIVGREYAKLSGESAAVAQAIFKTCRIDQPDPIAAWQTHLQRLSTWRDYLNDKRYAALHYQAPGTDLSIGLADDHHWNSGATQTPTGTRFTANLPTEEVFTLPHKDRIDGTVRASKPLSYAGTLIEDFSLTFKDGHVVDLHAAQGEAVLRNLIATDAGASSLGEVALVPHSSPISQSGLLFFNTLFDENAACHVALGRGFPFCLRGGAELSDEEFAAQGGNNSLIHIDFMIGSDQMNIDALTADGRREPLMRSGEWAFAS